MPAPAVIPARPPKKKITFSMEETFGRNWLPRLGITMLVVGVAMWAASKFGSLFLNPAVQVALCYLGGFAILAGGIFLERKENFRVLGRAMIGGGWAIVFFFTFAIGNIEHFQFVPIKVDLFLMVLVAGVMVWHTLKYNSQLVTGCAFLLGFTAVAIGHTSALSMLAGAILVAGMTVLVLRRQWFELEVFGILASFLNHLYWLYPIISARTDPKQSFADYPYSVALLIAYWAIFRFSYLWRTVADKQQESISTIAALLNPLLFMAIMKYQSHHPELAFYALLIMGAVEFTLGQLPVARRRRMPFLILSSLGATLMVASVPVRFADSHALEILWLAGAEVFLLAGILAQEKLFRYFGAVVSFLVALYLLPVRIMPLAEKVMDGEAHRDLQLSLVLAVVAAVFYANSHIIARIWRQMFDSDFERMSIIVLSYAGGIFAVAAVYAWLDYKWSAVALAVLVALLSWLGGQFRIDELLYQGHCIGMVAVIDVCVSDFALTPADRLLRIALGIVTLSLVAGLLYISSRFVRLSESLRHETAAVLYKWAASGLIGLLIARHASDWLVAVYWVAFALVLAVFAQVYKRNELRWQAFVLAVLSFLVALEVNLNKTGTFQFAGANLSFRLLSIGLVSAGVYVLTRWSPAPLLAPFFSWAGTILLGAVVWKETSPQWTAVVWIALATTLGIATRFWKNRALLWQTHAMAAAATLWMLLTNFQPSYNGTRSQLAAVFITSGLLYTLNWITNVPGVIEDRRISFVYSWAGSLLLSVLVFNAAQKQWIIVAWIALATGLAVAARFWKTRAFLWQTHILAAAATGWALWANFEPADRTGPHSWHHWFALGVTATLLYLLSWIGKITEIAESAWTSQVYPWAGTLLLSWMAFNDAPPQWVATVWIGMAVVLALAARYLKTRPLLWQTHLLALAATVWALRANFPASYGSSQQKWQHWFAVGSTAALLYLLTWLTNIEGVIEDRRLCRGYPWAGTLLLGWLAFMDAQQWTAVAWIVMAACLALAARYWKDRSLLWQTHLLALMAAGWAMEFNLIEWQGARWTQLIAVSVTFLLLYALAWVTDVAEIIGDRRIAQAYPWAGSVLVSWLVWYQLQPHNRCLAWGLLGLLLFEVGYEQASISLRTQGYIALVSAFVYMFFSNINGAEPATLFDPRMLTVYPLVLIYFWSYYRLHAKDSDRP